MGEFEQSIEMGATTLSGGEESSKQKPPLSSGLSTSISDRPQLIQSKASSSSEDPDLPPSNTASGLDPCSFSSLHSSSGKGKFSDQNQESQVAHNEKGHGGKYHEKYRLRWDNFSQSVVNSFKRLKEEEDFVDVTLACTTKQFTAHKVVLSACSPYFRRLLKVR